MRFVLTFITCYTIVLFTVNNSFSQTFSAKQVVKLETQLSKDLNKLAVNKKAFWTELDQIIEFYLIDYQLKKAERLIHRLQFSPITWSSNEKAKLYLYRAIISKYEDNYTDAQYCFLSCYDLLKQIKSNETKLQYYIELAEFNRKLGKHAVAHKQIYTAYKLCKAVPSVSDKQKIKLLNRLAAILNEENRIDKSIFYSKQAISLAQKNNLVYEAGISFNELGFSFKNLLILDSSEYYYKKASRSFSISGSIREYIHSEFNRALLYFHNNYNRVEAYNIMVSIEKLVKEKSLNYSLENVYEILINEAKLNNDKQKQIHYLELYHAESIKFITQREKSALLAVEKNFNDKKLSFEKERIKRNYTTSQKNLKQIRRTNFLMSALIFFLIAIIGLAVFFSIRLRTLNRKLVVQDSFNKRMMAVISHDLKGSMYLLSVLGKRVLNQQTERKDETVLRLNNQIQTSNEILDSLLKWLKSSFSKTKQSNGSSINAVWEIVRREFQEKLDDKGIEIILEAEPNSYIDLPADVLRIAMRNLISNGIKYSYDRSSVFIRIRSNFFQVQDFGTGIEAERVQQLFESDVISINGTLEESGFGIGLYMTYNMLLEYGFKINVTSILDEGTTTTISK